MFNDFWVVDKVYLRDIYLKYKFLNKIKEEISFKRNLTNIQRCIINKKLKDDIKKDIKDIEEINIKKVQNVIVGYKDRKNINKIKSMMKIQSVWKGYKIRKNMELMNNKIIENNTSFDNKKRVLIEDNIKRVMNDNNVITVELDEKINKGLEELDDDRYYGERFNEGVDKMERGLNTNMNGCVLCCCGLGNVCSYLFYKIRSCIRELFRDS
tara:strand:+ start:25 stop:657 length:633 start_codon:yes stop_codon:yes gene_type:complete